MAQSRSSSDGGSSSGGGNPSAPSATPGQPENIEWYQLFGFEGLNLKSGEAHIEDQQLLWCDNLHPIAPGKLVAMADAGVAIYTTPGGLILIGQPKFYNLGIPQYAAVLLSDGSVQQILAKTPFTVTQILPPATIDIAGAIDFTQWGAQFLIIVANSGNGYWLWDGTSLFTSGTIGPLPQIESGGSGYSSAPTITALGGGGSGATFSSTVQNGSVATIHVTNPGSGWGSTDAVTTALLFDNSAGLRSAHGTCGIADGVITDAVLDNGGSGYTTVPAVTITDAGGTGSGGSIVVNGISGGIITSLRVVNGGANYGTSGAVTLSFAGPGTGAAGHVVITNGVINSVVMTGAGNDIGDGYIDVPEAIFISPTGSGAQATPIMAGDTITGLNFTSGGSGYSGYAFVVFKPSAGPAYATVNLMPFGVNGISVATYLSRVWISHFGGFPFPPSVLFSNVGDPSDFGPPGGAFPLTEEYLRYKLAKLIPSGSFLYLIGDSSTGYITGVQTSGTPAVTTFSIVNIDPETGSPWKESVYNYSQAVIFANSFGVHQINGGAVRKVSTPIDDLYVSAQNAFGGIIPSSATGDVNGTHIYGLLFPVVDPITGNTRRLVLLWDGRRWWTYSPTPQIESIVTAEIDSTLVMWGRDSTKIYQLFQTFGAFQKNLKSKRYTAPGIMADKKALVLALLAQPQQNAAFSVSVQTENGNTGLSPGLATYNAGEMVWHRRGADGFGKTIGLLLSTTSPQFTINEIILGVQVYDIRVP